MSNALVTDASSIDVVEQADGTVLIRERPLIPSRAAIAFVLVGGALLAGTFRMRAGSWSGLVSGWLGGPPLLLAGTGLAALAADLGWSQLRVTASGVELSRRVLWYRVRKNLPLPVGISAPGQGLELTHRSGRYRFAARLNSLDSTRLVNYLLAKFPR